MPTAQFSIRIEASEIEKYYQGRVRHILVKATNGLKIQFPANLILPYVTHSGVSGQFLLHYEKSGKATSLKQL
jgi:hypothetical protein